MFWEIRFLTNFAFLVEGQDDDWWCAQIFHFLKDEHHPGSAFHMPKNIRKSPADPSKSLFKTDPFFTDPSDQRYRFPWFGFGDWSLTPRIKNKVYTIPQTNMAAALPDAFRNIFTWSCFSEMKGGSPSWYKLFCVWNAGTLPQIKQTNWPKWIKVSNKKRALVCLGLIGNLYQDYEQPKRPNRRIIMTVIIHQMRVWTGLFNHPLVLVWKKNIRMLIESPEAAPFGIPWLPWLAMVSFQQLLDY